MRLLSIYVLSDCERAPLIYYALIMRIELIIAIKQKCMESIDGWSWQQEKKSLQRWKNVYKRKVDSPIEHVEALFRWTEYFFEVDCVHLASWVIS